MTVVTLQEFSAWTEREGVFWHLAGAIRSAKRARTVLGWLMLPAMLPVAFVLAQIYPFQISRCTNKLKEKLPMVQDVAILVLVRDVLTLMCSLSGVYRRLSLFKGKMHETLDEMDELIDSLNLVLGQRNDLDEFMVRSEGRRSPDLPLPFTDHAAVG